MDCQKRPKFSKLVNSFNDLLEKDADYLELSRSLTSKEKCFPTPTSLPESELTTMTASQEQPTQEMILEHAI